MTLVTGEELKAYLGGLTLTTEQEGICESVILPGVQQELENYLNRPVEPVLVRESVRPDERGFLRFRVTPIHQIVSVGRSDGVATTLPVEWAPALLNPEELRILDEWGDPELYGYQLDSMSGGIGYPTFGRRPFYRVEYIAGYNGYVNEALKLDILRVTGREAEMQFDDTMSLRGGATEAAQASDTRQKGWTDEELRKWDRLRRRVMV